MREMGQFIFPCYCDICGAPRDKDSILCDDCAAELRSLDEVTCCQRCGKPLNLSGSPPEECSECLDRKLYFDHVHSLYLNKGPAHDLVLKLKYARGLHLAPVFAREMDRFLNRRHTVLPPDTLVVPVPQTLRSRLKRGYNQAEEIARHFAAQRNLFFSDLLTKSYLAKSQTRLNRRQRLTVNRKTVKIRKRRLETIPQPARHILLVDDVYTTGSTLNECARALKQALPHVRISVMTFLRS